MVPPSDFESSNVESNPDAGCGNDLLENVMDQTADAFSCPPKGGGNGSGEKEDNTKEEDGGEGEGEGEKTDGSNRNLDQELEDLDIGFDVFSSSASIKSVDATAADDNKTRSEDKNNKLKKDPAASSRDEVAKKTKTPSRQKESDAIARGLHKSASSMSTSSSTETKWDKRATRPQLFETAYIALRTEEYEVATLAASLGVPKPTRFGIPVSTLILSCIS
jgi:hypothetical protein